jgi:hypothetical protein
MDPSQRSKRDRKNQDRIEKEAVVIGAVAPMTI